MSSGNKRSLLLGGASRERVKNNEFSAFVDSGPSFPNF